MVYKSNKIVDETQEVLIRHKKYIDNLNIKKKMERTMKAEEEKKVNTPKANV